MWTDNDTVGIVFAFTWFTTAIVGWLIHDLGFTLPQWLILIIGGIIGVLS